MTTDEKHNVTHIEVHGDMVTNKHVDYEIGNVETGGIGVQINNYNEPAKKEAAEKPETKKAAASKQQAIGEKYATFRYKYFDENEGCRRLDMLFHTLASDDCGWLKCSDFKNMFEPLFSGQPYDGVMVWSGSKSQLKFLFMSLVDKKLITPQDGCRPCMILSHHFVDEEGNRFTDWNDCKRQAKRDDRAITAMTECMDIYRETVELTKDLFGKCNKKKGREG